MDIPRHVYLLFETNVTIGYDFRLHDVNSLHNIKYDPYRLLKEVICKWYNLKLNFLYCILYMTLKCFFYRKSIL